MLYCCNSCVFVVGVRWDIELGIIVEVRFKELMFVMFVIFAKVIFIDR